MFVKALSLHRLKLNVYCRSVGIMVLFDANLSNRSSVIFLPSSAV